MKTFVAVFLAVLLAGATLVGWQNYDKIKQNEHERSVLLMISLAESQVRLYNTRQNSTIRPSTAAEREKLAREIREMKEQIPRLKTLAQNPRTSAVDAKRLDEFASNFHHLQ